MASRQQAFLEIETRDGDKVMLRFSDSWQFSPRAMGGQQPVQPQVEPEFRFSLGGSRQCRDGCHRHPGQGGWTSWPSSSSGGGRRQTLADGLNGLQLDDSQLVSYSLKLKQSAKLSQTYQGGQFLQESLKPLADYLPRLSRLQQQADALLPTFPATGVDPTVLAARGQDGATQGQVSWASTSGCWRPWAARPADGDRLVWRRPVMPAGAGFCQPVPGLAHCPFPSPAMP